MHGPADHSASVNSTGDEKLNIEYSCDQKSLGGRDAFYVSETASGRLPSTPVTVSAELGYSKGAMAPHGPYLDWSLTASAPLLPSVFQPR